MEYDKDDFFSYDPNYDVMHQNLRPTVGKIDEHPNDQPIKNCAQTMNEVSGE